ncbi:hypothetical protein [Candidatus Phytoplasma pruni]|uniref:Uncharacterized protein n=1 Tax=Candidatus Phytoplasma pruni TaxID=479893 RepID=A0A851HBM9_9MOLU|nr:hypothetical protein [Candidatus Phytoplasma pruni]NWN45485.1 hypothetical protein [Candidatus Phytoplasma pruni]
MKLNVNPMQERKIDKIENDKFGTKRTFDKKGNLIRETLSNDTIRIYNEKNVHIRTIFPNGQIDDYDPETGNNIQKTFPSGIIHRYPPNKE